MDPEDLLTDALPEDARALIDEAEAFVAQLRSRADERADAIRERAEQEVADLQERAAEQVRQRQRRLVEALRPLQERYARAGRFDEALAIRERVRELSRSVADIRQDTGYLEIGTRDVGRSFLYEVVGSTEGPLWGTDLYTSDSSLGAAAVHAGLLAPDQRGLVRITVLGTLNTTFTGSQRNGVWSSDWPSHPFGYRVARP
jgi:hypothetical protein